MVKSSLRSKRQLIEKFIAENLPDVKDSESLSEEFDKLWSVEQIKAFDAIIKDEQLSWENTNIDRELPILRAWTN